MVKRKSPVSGRAPSKRPSKRSVSTKAVAGVSSASTTDGVPQGAGEAGDVLKDPEADEDDEPGGAEELQVAAHRPPPVHSDYLPLPWKGRLGYACLCTYLRYANPPVFSSRTCRIASILEQRHPLKDPSMPHHPTKNRPDREQPAEVARGQAYVQSLGLANARDIVKMLRWNEKFGIRFLRLSSEMFPFASHALYGYKLAPFASEVLAAAGRVAAELGHRLTTHPGQFTQLGSPRPEVIAASHRDLGYHAELLSLLKLPAQQDRDAVMILHMGGVFGDKQATLHRFRENYKPLSKDVKARLVLENDDVSWSVHDLLPICQELNIPLVLDYHHHNIIHSDAVREGTLDIMPLYEAIRQTWTRKNITQKMHYSEPTAAAITARQRRKHSPRVATLPPCAPDMDLMIEAKDKEQAVFELMRTFKLPGFDRFGDLIPHVREDENTLAKVVRARAMPKKQATKDGDDEEESIAEHTAPANESMTDHKIPDAEVSMGGPDGRVYWPPGMEEWLRPAKRVVATKKKQQQQEEGEGEEKMPKKNKAITKEKSPKKRTTTTTTTTTTTPTATPVPKRTARATPTKRRPIPTPTPETLSDEELPDSLAEDSEPETKKKRKSGAKVKVEVKVKDPDCANHSASASASASASSGSHSHSGSHKRPQNASVSWCKDPKEDRLCNVIEEWWRICRLMVKEWIWMWP
ncbi:MAG: UV-damage endonuclease [Thelocarpon superellum]|nr:MAG: UV-damage endonuclease [Thelocarpon superellum]